jgi:glucan-binding YG repeat protein
MKVTKVLSTAILFLLPAAMIPAYAQEHEQEKQPEQKQQQAKPAQHQQQAKPAKQQQPKEAKQQQAKPAKEPQEAKHEQQAKPAKENQEAKHQQQAKPAQQQQRGHEQQASRGAQTAGAHGSIPDARFRASFGSGHTFHVNRSEFANGSGRFQYGGYWFNVLNPWPVGWLYTDAVYVDFLNGGYFLCDPIHPGVYISINIG